MHTFFYFVLKKIKCLIDNSALQSLRLPCQATTENNFVGWAAWVAGTNHAFFSIPAVR